MGPGVAPLLSRTGGLFNAPARSQFESPAGLRELVVALDEQPLAVATLHADQIEGATQFIAAQFKTELSFLQLPQRVFAVLQLVIARVPDQLLARAVLAFGDAPLELQIFDRVIFGHHRQPPHSRVERRAFRRRPRLEHAAHFEAEIEMQPRSMMLLHYETTSPTAGDPPFRLRRLLEIPFAAIRLKPHFYLY